MFDTPVIDPSSIHLYHPAPTSRKGDNGRLLVIGGSKLFHSSIFWSADVASRIVDLVHFTSPANENNELVRKKLKDGFWNGIVVEWRDVEHYIEEDDCVLIGPGMVRESDPHDPNDPTRLAEAPAKRDEHPNDPNNIHSEHSDEFGYSDRTTQIEAWANGDKTRAIVNYLLKKYPTQRWVIDGGALQEVDPRLINEHMIITPNQKEFLRLLEKSQIPASPAGRSKLKTQNDNSNIKTEALCHIVSTISKHLQNCTIVLKGPTDIICQGGHCVLNKTGNEGMTKGGTGDVLAGLIAALYCNNEAWVAATAGTYVNGLAGDRLKTRVGVYYNAGDLVSGVPKALVSVAS